MLARAHKEFQREQHSEMYLLALKEQDKTKIELPLDMVSISASICRTIGHLLPQRIGILVHEHFCVHCTPASGFSLVYLSVLPRIANRNILHSCFFKGSGCTLKKLKGIGDWDKLEPIFQNSEARNSYSRKLRLTINTVPQKTGGIILYFFLLRVSYPPPPSHNHPSSHSIHPVKLSLWDEGGMQLYYVLKKIATSKKTVETFNGIEEKKFFIY